jgi:uncharacterized DUF497 family protein
MDIQYYAAKEDSNLRRHGPGFDDAVELLQGPKFVVEDVRRDYGERRFIAYGWIRQPLHVCVYTLRGTAHRLISLSKANRCELLAFGPKVVRSDGPPHEAIRTYLQVIGREPEAVARAVAAERAEQDESVAAK